jgi:hypothetical protein
MIRMVRRDSLPSWRRLVFIPAAMSTLVRPCFSETNGALVRSCRLRRRKRLHFDGGGTPPRAPEIVRHLIPQPGLRGAHPAFSSRIAISGETPLWPFRSSDNDPRETPSPFAAAVTVKPRGLRHSSRRISPGCGGSNICMTNSLISPMIVLEIHVRRVLSLDFENHAVIAGHRHRPRSVSVALQPMKPKTRRPHGLGKRTVVQARENASQFRGKLRIDAFRAAGSKQVL